LNRETKSFVKLVENLNTIDGFGWKCGHTLKDKGGFIRCACGCSQPSEQDIEHGFSVVTPGILRDAAVAIARLRRQRDEARREVCDLLGFPPQFFAQERGWDCFDGDTL
jgi:hypothetical protein